MNDLTQEEKIELLREALKRADYWLPCGYDIRHEDYEMNNRLIEDNQFIRKALNATDSPSDTGGEE